MGNVNAAGIPAEDPSQDLTGRVAIVTGAARGMGRAHARRLAAQGASVLLVDRDGVVAETAAELANVGGRVDHLAADLTAEGADALVVDTCLERFGRLDILVHNAGIMHDWRRLKETSPEELDRYFALNVRAPYALSRTARPHLARSGSGRIVFISSQWGQVPDGHSYGYMVSKAAQLGLMKALAQELVGEGILVNAIAPGAVRTRMVPDEYLEVETAAVPLGRLAEPGEIAALVGFLASDQAGFITGQTLPVNGGALLVGI
ncbi:3-oxoacyl-[acyl-carrier-protein] reductase [Arthrobacter ginkgonis]|uniref:3-oxoacyl-[acyl-carrier-protein] reductase n=1 Tax=Arthrobacter ginkgonis TaxID=1630594 RepID=A0ABP7C5J2_9MICC